MIGLITQAPRRIEVNQTKTTKICIATFTVRPHAVTLDKLYACESLPISWVIADGGPTAIATADLAATGAKVRYCHISSQATEPLDNLRARLEWIAHNLDGSYAMLQDDEDMPLWSGIESMVSELDHDSRLHIAIPRAAALRGSKWRLLYDFIYPAMRGNLRAKSSLQRAGYSWYLAPLSWRFRQYRIPLIYSLHRTESLRLSLLVLVRHLPRIWHPYLLEVFFREYSYRAFCVTQSMHIGIARLRSRIPAGTLQPSERPIRPFLRKSRHRREVRQFVRSISIEALLHSGKPVRLLRLTTLLTTAATMRSFGHRGRMRRMLRIRDLASAALDHEIRQPAIRLLQSFLNHSWIRRSLYLRERPGLKARGLHTTSRDPNSFATAMSAIGLNVSAQDLRLAATRKQLFHDPPLTVD